MIATQKITGSNALRKIPGGEKMEKFLCLKIAQSIDKQLDLKSHDNVLSTSAILRIVKKSRNIQNYESLFNQFFSEIDSKELSEMINSLLKLIELKYRSDFILLKLYIYVFFTDFWCQLVEYARKSNDQNLYFIGSKKRPEYAILKKALEVKFSESNLSTTTSNIYSNLQNTISSLSSIIKKRRELDLSRFVNNFEKTIPLTKYLETDKIIVIGILEERRLVRIAELYRELTIIGYKVVLFSCLHKSELIKGLRSYPILKDCVFYDNFLLNKEEVKSLLNSNKVKINRILAQIKYSDLLDKCTYHGVPLVKHTMDDLSTVLKHRYLEAAIDKEVITKYLKEVKVSCFIGMDNSVATSVWIDECKIRKIPTIFHFYNATESQIVYQTLIESVHPTAWFLGGEAQLKGFSSIKTANDNRFSLTGDIFADTVVNCDRKSIRETIRKQAGLEDHDKVIVLISSYIVSEFSVEAKKTLFQTVIVSAAGLGCKVIIKAHPNENLEVLRKEMAEWNVDSFIFHHENIRDVFISADLVCMYFSEAAQQAMLVGVPVISLVPTEMKSSFDKHWNYYSSGAVEFVPLGDDPSPVINLIISDLHYCKALTNRANVYTENLLGKCDGNNAKRFAATVHSIIQDM